MVRLRLPVAGFLCAVLFCAAVARCGEDEAAVARQEKEAAALIADIQALQEELDKSKSARGTVSKVDHVLEKKKIDDSAKSKDGKLVIGGLVQTWYTWYQRDSRGLFDNPQNGILDTNDGNDNSSFRVRRAELSFTLKANSYVTAHVMIDPAAETDTFPLITDNQAVGSSIFKRNNNVALSIDTDFSTNPPSARGLGNYSTLQNLQFGQGAANRILQDAYINFHTDPECPGDFEWHHDVQIGQFITAFGEEGMRSDAQLDFAERSFVGILCNNRDLGAQVHGTWINDRFQYWVGLWNGALDYHASNVNGDGAGGGNRSDTNDSKDIAFRTLVRPICNECWGDMELGYSIEGGYHGEAAIGDRVNNPLNNLEQGRTWALRQDAWAYYAPGGFMSGFWTRGEWGWFKDRDRAAVTLDYTGNGGTDYLNNFSGTGLAQANGRAYSVEGFYVAGGYRFDNPNLCCVPKWAKPFELALRYQTFQNVLTANLFDPTKTDVYSTQVYTGGINYYIKDSYAKIQANYNAVINPQDHAGGGQRNFHDVKNNSFVISFQVAF